MSSVNKAILVGHLGRDPEVRTLTSGAVVASFSLATSERWKDKATGETRERTEWHEVVIYNEGLAKVAERYLAKGSKVYVEGRLQAREWEDKKTGEKRRRTEVVLQAYHGELVLLGDPRADRAPPPTTNPREGAGPASSQPDAAAQYAAARSGATPPASQRPALDDDIPF